MSSADYSIDDLQSDHPRLPGYVHLDRLRQMSNYYRRTVDQSTYATREDALEGYYSARADLVRSQERWHAAGRHAMDMQVAMLRSQEAVAYFGEELMYRFHSE
jgi:hypothetical protein